MQGVGEALLLKNNKSEDECITGIAAALTTDMKYARSPNNQSLSSSKIAFQVFKLSTEPEKAEASEGQENEAVPAASEEKCSTVVCDVNYKHKGEAIQVSMLFPGTSVSDDTCFQIDGSEDVNLRGTVYHITSNLAGDSLKGEARFSQTVAELLRATRALCFS
jgi:hypothetical protein